MTARQNALIRGGAIALFALVSAAMPSALAQDATPVPDAAIAQEATPVADAVVPRPVHIHAGDCVNLGEVVVPLNDLTAPVGEGAGQAEEATQAESSGTNIPLSLPDILAADHAINVHLSAEQIDTYIACGEVGGIVDINGALIVGLREASNSGFTGIAYLAPGADGVSTEVSLFIAPVFGPAG